MRRFWGSVCKTAKRWKRRIFSRHGEKHSLLQEGHSESYVIPYARRRELMKEESVHFSEAAAVPPRMLELLSGVMLGMLIFAFCNVYASAVFMQHSSLYPHLQAAVGINVLAAAVLCAISVRYSKLGVYVGSPDINPTIIHVALVNHLVQTIPPDLVEAQLLPTLITAIALSTALVSISTYVLGTFHLTRLVQFAPTTVVRGFLACVGMEIIRTAIENATGTDFQPNFMSNMMIVANLHYWMWLLPALAVGVPLYVLKRFHLMSSGVLFPLFLTFPVFLFYAILLGTDTSLEQSRHDGWLYPESKPGDCLDHWRNFDYSNINIHALLGSGSYMIIMVIIVSVDFLLKLVGTEDTLQRDVDFDHEFCVTGVANSLLGVLLLPPGYGSLKFMLLNYSVVGNADVRLPTAVAAIFNFLLFAAGFPLINYLPRFFLAGLFIYAALAFMVENLVDSYRLLTKKEYCVVWLLVVLHFFLPLYVEVGLGLLLASGIFVVQYATRSPIKVMMSGADYRAVTRTLPETQKLSQLGSKMLTIVRLQGYIFFGSATQVVEALAPLVHSDNKYTFHHHIVLDFDEVTGVDSSSNAVFHKFARQTRNSNFTILWSGLNPRRYMRFKEAQVITTSVTFPDIDSAVEWVEDQMLQFSRVQREKWLVSDVLRYIHAVHYVQYRASATCHGLLSPSLLRRFASYCESKTFRPGKRFEPGTVVKEFYFIRDGRVEVFLPTGDGGRFKRIGIRSGGSFVYVEAFWLNRKAEAMLQVTELTHVWALTREAMERMQQEAPEIAIRIRDSVLRHIIITDMRLRRRLLAFGGSFQSQTFNVHTRARHTSWCPRVTGAVCSVAMTLDEMADMPGRTDSVPTPKGQLRRPKPGEGYLPPLLDEEVAQYTEFYKRHVVSAPLQSSFAFDRNVEHLELLQAIHIVLCLQAGRLSETDALRCDALFEDGMPPGDVTLDQFLACMRHALLAPLAMATKDKLWEMFSERAGGRETIDASHLYDMCRPVGHDVSNEQLRELLTEVDEDICCAITFDKVLHLFSRLQRRRLFAQQLERVFCRFLDPVASCTDEEAELGSPFIEPAGKCITVEGLRESLPHFGVSYDELTIKDMILEADFNNDGTVDFDEFVTAVCSL